MDSRYSIEIQWSVEDQAQVGTLPEWRARFYQPVTDGATYEEAARKCHDVSNKPFAQAQQHGETLPDPQIHVPTAA